MFHICESYYFDLRMSFFYFMCRHLEICWSYSPDRQKFVRSDKFLQHVGPNVFYRYEEYYRTGKFSFRTGLSFELLDRMSGTPSTTFEMSAYGKNFRKICTSVRVMTLEMSIFTDFHSFRFLSWKLLELDKKFKLQKWLVWQEKM